VEDACGVARTVRERFRADASLPRGSDAASAALDRGFDALRLLNDMYAPALAARARARAAHEDRHGILYSLGTTFRHKLFGYTGVIVGWDRTCARSPDWVDAFTTNLDAGAAQPFYAVLPDARDCAALFGGPRESKYVAQENVEPLYPPGLPPRALGGIGRRPRIVHPLLDRYFLGFSRDQGRYLPRREVAFEYPDESDDPAGSLEGLEGL
jgi:hemimethylated DNA binding protein